MITTHLFFNLKMRDEASISKAKDILMSLKDKVEQLSDISVEADIGHKESRYDLSAIERFNSLEDFKAVAAHPVHMEAVKYILNELDAQVLFYMYPSSDTNHQAIYGNGKQ